ncbi:MAG: IS607 family transposase [Promethearchaeota archaeon]
MFFIGMAAMLIGVCNKTLRIWEKRALISPMRTPGGYRRYSMNDLIQAGDTYEERQNGDQINPKKLALLYSRVSSHKQKKRGDLERQQQYLEQYCTNERLTNYIHITDTASGLNTKRSGLRKIFKFIKAGKVARIVVTSKDRLTRFGLEYLVQYCALFNVAIMAVINSLGKSVQQELVDDMVSLIACFSGKLYGFRSQQARVKNRAKVTPNCSC